ncbi:MAG: hypothetical protein P4M08_06270 [Oligoflexia bacterium]|nr:hypothetical protein [Oligoflexia bacterium]
MPVLIAPTQSSSTASSASLSISPSPSPSPSSSEPSWSVYAQKFDASGNLYFADSANGLVREITMSTGIITAFAGLTNQSQIYSYTMMPRGSAFDSAGNLYMADMNSFVVWKIAAADGTVSIAAGTFGVSGYSGDGDFATRAELYSPSSVALDASGNLYIADYWSHVVRKVSASGIISTIAGTGTAGYSGDGGPAISAELNVPSDVSVDGSGNLYIADTQNSVVRMVAAADGKISTVAGNHTYGFSGDGGLATNAKLSWVNGVTADNAGNLYLADTRNEVIRKVTASTGKISTIAGSGGSQGYTGDGGPATSATLWGPTKAVLDPSGNIYIADSSNNVVREVSASTGIITTVIGNGTAGDNGDGGPATAAEINAPSGLAVDASGNVYVSTNNQVRELNTTTGTISTYAGMVPGEIGDGGPATDGILYMPASVAIDSAGNTYISDDQDYVIRKVSPSGTISTAAGTFMKSAYSGDGGPATEASFSAPTAIALDRQGNIYVVDTGGYRIRKIDATTGDISTIAGNGTMGYTGDGGPAINAEIGITESIAIDEDGNVYFADYYYNVVREVLASGTITTVAGTGTAGNSGDGQQAVAADLNLPIAVALNAAGELYIADYGNNRVRKVSNGVISTIAGTGTAGDLGDGGPATAAEISPSSLALDRSGNIYVADAAHNVIRMITVSTGIISAIAGTGTAGLSGDGELAIIAELQTPYF